MNLNNQSNRALAELFSAISKQNNNANLDGFYLSDKAITDSNSQVFASLNFEKNINVVLVDDRQGKAFLACVGDAATSRTDTQQHERQTHGLFIDTMSYDIKQVNTDIHVPYALLNRWATAGKKFNQHYSEYVKQRVAIDRLTIGWHGSSVANDTNPVDDPLLRDVGVGWLSQIKNQFPGRCVGLNGEKIFIGKNIGLSQNDTLIQFGSLDGLVNELVGMIPVSKRKNLVCIIGDELLRLEQSRLYDNDNFFIEKASTNIDAFASFSGVPRATCLGFPSFCVVVTAANNLSIYFKSSSSYREVKRETKRERVEDYRTDELAYVVEDIEAFVCVLPGTISTQLSRNVTKSHLEQAVHNADKISAS